MLNRQNVIDPSEIIIEKEERREEISLRINPWIRFIARLFDYALFFLVLLGLRFLSKGHFLINRQESWIPIEFFIWIPIEALLLWKVGTTMGKAFLKIKVQRKKHIPFDFPTALRRSFHVWLRGLGMMIPIFNCLCLALAYYRLNAVQYTSWDRDEHLCVTHAMVPRWRIIFSVIVSCAIFLVYYRV